MTYLEQALYIHRLTLYSEDQHFWNGYIAGIGDRKNREINTHTYFRKKTHEPLMERMESEGYRAGYLEKNPVAEYHRREQHITARTLAQLSGVSYPTIRSRAYEIPGGRKVRGDWKFPRESADWVRENITPRGRRKKCQQIKK